MDVNVQKIDGSVAEKKIRLSSRIFGIEPNDHAIYSAVRAQMANRRRGTAATKNRAQVRGGGRKPWRQKGTGRARAGTIRSPIWVGGGRAFGPKPHSFAINLPKKMKRLARKSMLSYKAREGKIMVVEDFQVDSSKTRDMVAILRNLDLDEKKTLLLIPQKDANLLRAGRNIPNLIIREAENASTYDLLNCEVLLIQESAVRKLHKGLSS